MLFKEIIAVYSEYHIKPFNALCGQNSEILNVKVRGTFMLPLCYKELTCDFLSHVNSIRPSVQMKFNSVIRHDNCKIR
jgi:hypothetical protein